MLYVLWFTAYDTGPALAKHYVHVSRLHGMSTLLDELSIYQKIFYQT